MLFASMPPHALKAIASQIDAWFDDLDAEIERLRRENEELKRKRDSERFRHTGI